MVRQATPSRRTITDQTLQRVAHTLKAVAHPVRLRIIELLEDREMCVSELIDALGTKPAITSQQLGLMRDRGILECRRDGNFVYYRVSNPNVVRVIACIRNHCDQQP
jgi:DNA-binding transcriptional ArsR family regulator